MGTTILNNIGKLYSFATDLASNFAIWKNWEILNKLSKCENGI